MTKIDLNTNYFHNSSKQKTILREFLSKNYSSVLNNQNILITQSLRCRYNLKYHNSLELNLIVFKMSWR